MMSLSHLVVFAAAALPGVIGASAVVVPPQPTEVANSTAFAVSVRPAGDEAASWESVPLYKLGVHEINSTTGSAVVRDTTVGYFDYDGTVEVNVVPDTSVYPTISTAVVRPVSYGISAEVSGGNITFSLSQPHNNVVLEINGEVFNLLHLWSNTIETDGITEEQAAEDDSIIFYGSGYHSPENGSVTVTAGQTLYLASGAVLSADVAIQNTSDVTVRGRGFIHKPSYGAIRIEWSENVSVSGISVMNPGAYSITAGTSKNIHVSEYRSISGTQYGDGLDFFCCQDVVVEKAFLRTSDDCIALYQHRNEYYGNSSNITVRDSSLWADVAHPINLGTHGNPLDPETMDGVVFQNIDILDHREPQIDYEGCLAITCGDENLIQNLLFDDIRVEDFRWGMLLSMRVVFNTKYNTGAGRGIKNVTIRDLVYSSSGANTANTAFMGGYSADRSIDFVDFQGLTINDLHIWDGMDKPGWYASSDFVPMVVGQHVNNVTFSS